MRINHKFLNIPADNNPFNWHHSFYTENAILKNIEIYNPEILVLGTFNPNLTTNLADIFYGRNYFWPAFKNLFINGVIDENLLIQQRLNYDPYNPNLNEIFVLCQKLKLTFTDLIESIFSPTDNTQIIHRAGKEYILFNEREYNPISDIALQRLNAIKKVNWNTPNIIKYLNLNRKIRTIFLTRRENLCWQKQTNQIRQTFPAIKLIPIYTPTALGGAVHQQTQIYGEGKMKPLLRHWVHNNGGNYGNLNHNNWLIENGVNIDNF